MSKAVKNIMIRVIKAKLAAGEDFEDIIKDYPKLTQEDITEIQNELND